MMINLIYFDVGAGTFASGGSDSNVFFWDGENKKKLGKVNLKTWYD